MNYQRISPACRSAILLKMVLILLASAIVTPAQTTTPFTTPAAVVKNILVNNQELTDANGNQAVVTRAGSSETVYVSAGLLLYRGDVVETFNNTKLTVLFLDEPVPERDNEVIFDANARIVISSSYSWWGRIWVKVKGAFDSRSSYVRLAPRGTEYEFTVVKGTERSTLIVLEGAVEFEKGKFNPATSRQGIDFGPSSITAGLLFPRRSEANFAHRFSWQAQAGRALDVQGGRITEVVGTYHILNDCKETHRFEFRTSDTTRWLTLSVPKTVEIPARKSLPVEATLRIDARQVSSGQHRTSVYAICLDCDLEPGCSQYQLNWPLNITVKDGPPPPPDPIPPVTPQAAVVRELEEIVFTTGTDQPTPTTDSRVLSVLDWTNNVILNTQPSYTAQNIIPHFSTIDERSQSFRTARERSILKNDVGSHAVLGHVYTDWGQAALAVTAYRKEISVAPGSPPTLMVHLSEAYRLTGQLSEARRTLNEALKAEPQSVLALNADGNLSLDNAEIAADKGDNQQARTLLVQARTSYGIALRSSTAQSGSIASSAVVKTNLGEAYIADGNAAQRQNKIPEAKTQYGEAVAQLEPIQQPGSEYPFAVTDLGRAYQGLGDAAVLEKNKAEAVARYKGAQAQHEKAIAAHPDFAEAHHNLGDLFDDLGNKEAAKESYRRAIKARPEQPDSYYPLAVLIQREDPRLAAALASAYLKLEREVFKQGEKARKARLIEQQIPVDSPVRPGARLDQIDTGSTTDPSTTTTTTTTTTPGTVPNLVQMSRAEALSAIQNAGYLVGKIKEKSEYRSKDVVIEQKPVAGTAARPGSKIELVINVGKLVEVPDVIDDREATARRKITKDGLLRIGTIDREVSCEPPGEVVRQTPIKNAKVEPDTVVNLVIAYPGEDALTVPSLIGRSRDDAEAAIRSSELILKEVKPEETNREREGTVLRQKPDSGTLIARQCKREVEITVAVPLILVGNYVGLPVDEARRQLNEITLYGQIGYQATSQYRPGIVISQNPQPGSPVRRRSAVYLVVATTPAAPPPPPVEDLVTIPTVRGMTPEEARAALERAGLSVPRAEKCEAPSYLRSGVGVDRASRTEPGEGQRVPLRTNVTLVIVRKDCGLIL